jgi:hypothetical protein
MNEDLFAKLAAEEEKFFSSEFFSPVIQGRPVRVQIAGIVVSLKVRPKKFEGWGIFKTMKNQETARFVREPTMQEKRRYLDLYPKCALVVSRQGKPTLGITANQSDARFKIQGQVPISLPDEAQVFDTVDVRFDGVSFWYDGKSSFRGPRIAQTFRDLLAEETEPDKVEVSGATREERLAYQLAFIREIESKKDREEEKIKGALERAGAIYRSYVERGNTYTVEYTVDGNRHRSVVDRETLQVQSAGICLTDHATGHAHDSDFDLQSLVSVIREGENRRLIYRM